MKICSLKKKLFSFCFIFAFLIIFTPCIVDAIGIAPSQITLNGVLDNSTVEKKVNIIRSQKESYSDLSFNVKTSGTGAQYIEMPEKRMTLEYGETEKEFIFYIKPKNAGINNYEAQIIFISEAVPNSLQTNMAINMGLSAKVAFDVVEEKRSDLVINDLFFYQKADKITLDYSIKNKGNSVESVQKIEIKVTNQSNEVVFKQTVSFSPEYALHEPFGDESFNFVFDIPKQIKRGSYSAKIVFQSDNKEVVSFEKPISIRPLVKKNILSNFMDILQNRYEILYPMVPLCFFVIFLFFI
ncbi:MAG: hypothetical protein ABH832_02795 [bacterium]